MWTATRRAVIFTAAAVVLCVVWSPGCAAEATLTTLTPSADDVLRPPEGLEGDFDVAKAPPVIDFTILPDQWEGAKLWSNWGDSICASDGNYYCAIGDHDGPHGYSYVYKVDPLKKTARLVVDYNKVVGMPADKYAPGKLHGPLMEAEDGWLYFIGYRAGPTTEEVGYKGDWMLRYNLQTGKTENLGIPVPYNSVPSSIVHLPSKTMYGLCAPGQTASVRRARFFAYDMAKKKIAFIGGPTPNMVRAVLMAKDGRVYYSHSPAPPKKDDAKKTEPKRGTSNQPDPTEGVLARYDPKTNDVTLTGVKVPGRGTLRAASRPDARGVAYGITRDGVVFSFDTKTEKLKPMTKAFVKGSLYTTSMRLGPTDRYLYYIPSAHGGSIQHGTAVIQLDVKTGKRKVLAFLNEYIRKQMNYNLGGTFGIALNKDASQLFICFNGAKLPKEKPDFGLCSVMVLHIPEGER